MPDTPEQQPTPAPSREPPPGHPLLEGLWRTLPPPGAQWSAARRERWLAAARNILDLIYLPGDRDAH